MKYETKDGQTFELTGLPPHAEGKALTLHDVDGSSIEVEPSKTGYSIDITTDPDADAKQRGWNDAQHEINFWLGLPIKYRPLKFIPGRNRREKRMFQKLASQAERGTISRGRKGRGGNLAKLRGLYNTLKALGVLRGGEK